MHTQQTATCCIAGPEVQGILLAGGVLRDATLAKQTAGSVRAVFAPKVAGAHAAVSAAYGAPLAAMKLFSSVAASMGSGGQANYAAANAVLDATAVRLQHQVREAALVSHRRGRPQHDLFVKICPSCACRVWRP